MDLLTFKNELSAYPDTTKMYFSDGNGLLEFTDTAYSAENNSLVIMLKSEKEEASVGLGGGTGGGSDPSTPSLDTLDVFGDLDDIGIQF